MFDYLTGWKFCGRIFDLWFLHGPDLTRIFLRGFIKPVRSGVVDFEIMSCLHACMHCYMVFIPVFHPVQCMTKNHALIRFVNPVLTSGDQDLVSIPVTTPVQCRHVIFFMSWFSKWSFFESVWIWKWYRTDHYLIRCGRFRMGCFCSHINGLIWLSMLDFWCIWWYSDRLEDNSELFLKIPSFLSGRYIVYVWILNWFLLLFSLLDVWDHS